MAAQVAVRRATSADSGDVLDVIARAIRLSAVDYYSKAALESWANDFTEPSVRRRIEETDAFVAADGPRVVGFVNLDREDVDLSGAPVGLGHQLMARARTSQHELA